MPYGSGVLGGLGSILGASPNGNYAQQQAYNAAQAAQQQQQYVNFANFATTTSTTANTWTSNQTSSTTLNAIYGYAQQQQADFARPPTDFELEQYLERKLQRENKMLLECKRFVFMPRLAFDPAKGPNEVVGPLNIPERLGYMLQKAESYLMPDGSRIALDEHGNYFIDDHDAKVTYRANRLREFNPYINASDQLERFIKEVGRLDGVEQTEVLDLPVGAFINWLVLQAALKDGDRTSHLPRPEAAIKPRLALPKPTHVEVRKDLQRDCLIVREIHERVIPRSALVEGEWDLTQKYGIKAA